MTQKIFTSGTYRSELPEKTFEKISHLFPILGITRIANITGLDRIGIPVVAAIRPNSRSLAISQGKGHSLLAAKVSAAMESIESYHAENITAPTLYTSYDTISFKHKVIDIKGLTHAPNKAFYTNKKILWLEGYDLLNNENKFVPYDSVSADLTIDELPDSIFLPDSNGLASGNTLLEAQIHAICEVIERDNLSIFWFINEETRNERLIDINTIQDDNLQNLIERIKEKNINISIWDISYNTEIPTYICKLTDLDEEYKNFIRPTFGSGTHLNREIALSRAITEAAQSRVTFISGARDDQYKSVYRTSLSDDFVKSFSKYETNSGTFSFHERINLNADTFEGDLEILLSTLKKSGLREVVCIDLTREEFSIPVCKVIIPHMQLINNVSSKNERFTKILENYIE